MVLVQPQRVCPPCLLQTMFGLPMVTSHWGASPPGCTSEKPNRHLSGASPCHALAQPAFVPQLRLARAPGRLNLRKSTWPNQAPTWYNVRYEEDAKYLHRMCDTRRSISPRGYVCRKRWALQAEVERDQR